MILGKLCFTRKDLDFVPLTSTVVFFPTEEVSGLLYKTTGLVHLDHLAQ